MKSLFSIYRQDLRRMALVIGNFQTAMLLNAGNRKNLISGTRAGAICPECGGGVTSPGHTFFFKPSNGFFVACKKIIFGLSEADFRSVDVIKHDLSPFGFRPSGLDCSPAFDFLKMQTGGLSICIRPELLRPVISTHPKKRMQWNVE